MKKQEIYYVWGRACCVQWACKAFKPRGAANQISLCDFKPRETKELNQIKKIVRNFIQVTVCVHH